MPVSPAPAPSSKTVAPSFCRFLGGMTRSASVSTYAPSQTWPPLPSPRSCSMSSFVAPTSNSTKSALMNLRSSSYSWDSSQTP